MLGNILFKSFKDALKYITAIKIDENDRISLHFIESYLLIVYEINEMKYIQRLTLSENDRRLNCTVSLNELSEKIKNIRKYKKPIYFNLSDDDTLSIKLDEIEETLSYENTNEFIDYNSFSCIEINDIDYTYLNSILSLASYKEMEHLKLFANKSLNFILENSCFKIIHHDIQNARSLIYEKKLNIDETIKSNNLISANKIENIKKIFKNFLIPTISIKIFKNAVIFDGDGMYLVVKTDQEKVYFPEMNLQTKELTNDEIEANYIDVIMNYIRENNLKLSSNALMSKSVCIKNDKLHINEKNDKKSNINLYYFYKLLDVHFNLNLSIFYSDDVIVLKTKGLDESLSIVLGI